MKIYIFISFVTFFALASGVFVPPRPGHKKLVEAKECTLGPSYWCQNLTSAAGCNAVKHCIQTVWVYQQLPPDTSTVCQTCLDMVKQARDQLMSNDTQDLIKQVFEGSCALLHVKAIVKECDKIADQFIPELIDTLASEMNPQVVCSVAGLCNNERVHRLLEQAGEKKADDIQKPDNCEGCHTVVNIIENNFNKMSRDDVLQKLLEVCGRLGSFSDGCSNIVVTYFTEIYDHLRANLNSNEVCLMSGECSAQFHTHANVEITPMSHIGYVPVGDEKDDLPCELCEQLVQHLRDLLVSNTTEEEFKKVLDGLCKQTKGFAKECQSLADQYYDEVYQFLTNALNSTVMCDLIGICKKSNSQVSYMISPLLPVETVDEIQITPATKKPLARVPLQKDVTSVKVMSPLEDTLRNQQLPIDLLMPPHTQVLYNTQVCIFCEYFLHFLQQEITDPKTEDKIKEIIEKACSKMPSSINDTCTEFVNIYEPAMLAILAQEIDPSQVCPKIRACPSSEAKDVEIFMQADGDNKCPLCLFAVTKLEDMVKDKKSKESIKNALDKLCVHLPSDSLNKECQDFVSTYTDELVEMLIADLKPDEICVYLKLCSDKRPVNTKISYVDDLMLTGDVETNIIHDDTINGVPIESPDTPVSAGTKCVVCEFVLKEIKSQLENQDTIVEIKQVVNDICNFVPSSVKEECNTFVKQYADTVIELLSQSIDASKICSKIKLCNVAEPPKAGAKCEICELVMNEVKSLLQNQNSVDEIKKVINKVCSIVPQSVKDDCDNFLQKYEDKVIQLLGQSMDASKICSTIKLCSIPESPKGVECVICKLVLKEIKSQLQNQHTVDEVKKVVSSVCNIVPHASKDECNSFIKKYSDKVIQLLSSQSMDPSDVCSTIFLCSAVDPPPTDGVKCVICELVLKEIKTLLQNQNSVDAIENVINKVCSIVPNSVKDDCNSFIQKYDDRVIQLLSQSMDPSKVCSAITLCSITDSVISDATLVDNDSSQGVECIICKLVLKEIKTLLQNQNSVDAIEKAISKVCSIVPNSVKDDCNSFIQKYDDRVIQLLSQSMDPSKVCSAITLCSVPDTFRADAKCVICDLVLKEIKSLLRNQNSADDIKKAINKVCSILPHSVKDDCNSFVQRYDDKVSQLLSQSLDPSKVCSTIKLCVVAESPRGAECTICKLVLKEINSQLQNQHTSDEIKKVVNNVCNVVPRSSKDECNSFMQKYEDKVIQLLIQSMDPGQVCSAIMLCTVSSSPQCVLCEFVMKEIEDELKDKKTDDEIKNVVHDICNIMPRSVKSQCTDFVNQYADTIIQLLIATLEPSEICSMMKLCNSQFELMADEILDCPVCHLAVEAMNKILQNPKVSHDVNHVLEKTCRAVPKHYRNKCTTLVNESGKMIITFVEQGAEKDAICPLMGKCGNIAQPFFLN